MKNLCASFDWFSMTKLSARSIQAAFFCPTNKDSIHKKPSKPIGFLMWVKKLQGEKHLGIRYLVSNSEELFFWALVWPRSKWKWDFFLSVNKFQSSGVPIWLLKKTNFFSHIFIDIMEILYTTFERFLMTPSSARSILVKFSSKKNLTSNGSKPIGVLTRTKSSRSDLRLPNAYSLLDF